MSVPTRPGRSPSAALVALALVVVAGAPSCSLADGGLSSSGVRTSPTALPPAWLYPPARLLLPSTDRSGFAEGGAGEVRHRLRSPLEDPGSIAPDQAPRRNTWLPLGEVVATNFLLWQASYWAGADYAKINGKTIAENFRNGWIIDSDPFWTNQLGHPYQGAAYYTAARSTGHGPYASFGISFLGSLMWEQFGEVQSPSLNDQVTTTLGGSVFGEVLYRMYRLVLDTGGARPGGWRKLGAFALSPVSGVNHALVGPKYNGAAMVPTSWMGELELGAVIGGQLEDAGTDAQEGDAGPWVSVGAHVMYGVPGDPELRLRDPFDHFDARFSMSFAQGVQPAPILLMRGLVVGTKLGEPEAPVGLWGLFSSYDVIAVPLFGVSGVGLGPGVSLMHRWGSFELHGTGLIEFLPWAGDGYVPKRYGRDYLFGTGVKEIVDLRGLLGDRVILDLIARDYFVSGAYATNFSESFVWSHAAVTARIVGSHAVSLSVDWASRHATIPGQPDISQRGAVLQVHYSFLLGW
jgi:hypothetical protein